MLKKIIIIFLLLSNYIGKSQVNVLVKKFFFDLPAHAILFDIRTQVQTNNNFSEVHDYSTSLYANFNYHPYINNLSKTKMKPHLSVQFNEKGLSNVRTINIYYSVDQVSECINRYDEIVKLFKPYAKKTSETTLNDSTTGEKTGTGLKIYPTNGANFFLLDISYSYNKIRSTYELQILLWEDNLWQ